MTSTVTRPPGPGRPGPDAHARLAIAVLADDLYPGYGGQARATEGHIGALRARGHDLRVLAGREHRPAQPPEGVLLRRLPTWRPGRIQTHFVLPSPAALNWLLEGADVLQANTPGPSTLLAARLARRRGIPVAMGVHAQLESTTMHLPIGRGAATAGLRAWYRRVYGAADVLTAPTPFAARMAAGLTPTPARVVSNGVPVPDEVPSQAEARARLAHLLGPDLVPAAGVPVLLYVGRLSPEKRPGDLLPLLAALPVNTRLWIAGEGPLEERLREEAKSLGVAPRTHLLGYVPETSKRLLLAAADLFAMPSPTELQSIATLEAMAHGLPVAAAGHASSAVPELVRESGAGIVHAADRPASTAREIATLLADAGRLDGLRAHARAYAAEHSLERSAEVLVALYRDLLAHARPAGADRMAAR